MNLILPILGIVAGVVVIEMVLSTIVRVATVICKRQ